MVLEKTLESLLDCKEIHPVHPKGDQSWVFIGRTDVEAKTPTLWPPDVKSWLIGKDPDAGKNWGQEEKGMTEDEMVGWHHWLKTWVWVNSRSWWWTGRPGVLQFMGVAKIRTWLSDWTELNWTERLERASLVAEMIKNLPTMQESQFWSLGWEDPLEEGMATHTSILAWRIPWMRSLTGYSPWGCKELDMTEQLTHMHTQRRESLKEGRTEIGTL